MAKRFNRGYSTPETNSQTLLLRKIYSWNIPHWYFAYSLTIPFVLLHGILVSLILLPTSHSNPNIYPLACSLTHQSSSHPQVCPISNINLTHSPHCLSCSIQTEWVPCFLLCARGAFRADFLTRAGWRGSASVWYKKSRGATKILQCMGQPSNFKEVSTPKHQDGKLRKTMLQSKDMTWRHIIQNGKRGKR